MIDLENFKVDVHQSLYKAPEVLGDELFENGLALLEAVDKEAHDSKFISEKAYNVAVAAMALHQLFKTKEC